MFEQGKASLLNLHVSVPFPFPRAAPVPAGRAHRAESARCRWPLVVVARVGWSLLATTPDVTKEAVSHSAFPPSPFSRTPLKD
jgi:hypothetical protein